MRIFEDTQSAMGLVQLDSQAAALIGVIIIVGYVVSAIRQWVRLRHFNGPVIAGFSQLWLISRVGGGRTHLDLWEACKKYGEYNKCDVLVY